MFATSITPTISYTLSDGQTYDNVIDIVVDFADSYHSFEVSPENAKRIVNAYNNLISGSNRYPLYYPANKRKPLTSELVSKICGATSLNANIVRSILDGLFYETGKGTILDNKYWNPRADKSITQSPFSDEEANKQEEIKQRAALAIASGESTDTGSDTSTLPLIQPQNSSMPIYYSGYFWLGLFALGAGIIYMKGKK